MQLLHSRWGRSGEAKAADIARLARKLKLTHMTADCLPAFDLPSVPEFLAHSVVALDP